MARAGQKNTVMRSRHASAMQLGTIVQLLSAFACVLAAIALPLYFPQDAHLLRWVMFSAAGFFILLAVLSRVFRDRVAAFSERWNLDNRVLVPREGFVFLGIMLFLAVAALSGGSATTGNSLLLIFGLMAGSFVVNGWVVLMMKRQLECSRTLPSTALAGVPFSVWVTVRNRRRRLASRLLQAEDEVDFAGVVVRPLVTFLRVSPGAARTAAYRLQIPVRGRVIFRQLQISTQFPLGIGRSVLGADEPHELLVVPRPGRLLPAWQQLVALRGEEDSRMRESQSGRAEEEFVGLRDYRNGDRLRQIHWLSTARSGSLKVRDFRPHQKTSIAVILDLFCPEEAAEELLERAISLAATVCSEVSDDNCGGEHCLVIGGKNVVAVQSSAAIDFRQRCGRALAECELSRQPLISDLLRSVGRVQGNRRHRWLLLTARPQAWQSDVGDDAVRLRGTALQVLTISAANLQAWFQPLQPSQELLAEDTP